MRAWQAFFADEKASDGVGVQTRYVAMLGHVASGSPVRPRSRATTS